MPFGEVDELQSPLFVFLYSRQSLFFILVPSQSSSHSVSLNSYGMNKWDSIDSAVVFCETEPTVANQKFVLLGFVSKTDSRQDQKS